MGVGISFKAVGTLVELAIPWILSYIIDDLIPLKEIRPVDRKSTRLNSSHT